MILSPISSVYGFICRCTHLLSSWAGHPTTQEFVTRIQRLICVCIWCVICVCIWCVDAPTYPHKHELTHTYTSAHTHIHTCNKYSHPPPNTHPQTNILWTSDCNVTTYDFLSLSPPPLSSPSHADTHQFSERKQQTKTVKWAIFSWWVRGVGRAVTERQGR